MKRVAFKMKLLPGVKEEYKKRHQNIWPELKELLLKAGIRDYSIFFDQETDTLFAVQKISGESDSQELGETEIVQKWWAYMADIMETNPDNSPLSVSLEEVFYME
jgi:L-rhamnose mutarotase